MFVTPKRPFSFNWKWGVRGIKVTAVTAVLGMLGGGCFGLLLGAGMGVDYLNAAFIPAATLACSGAGTIAGLLRGFFGTLFEGPPTVEAPHRWPDEEKKVTSNPRLSRGHSMFLQDNSARLLNLDSELSHSGRLVLKNEQR